MYYCPQNLKVWVLSRMPTNKQTTIFSLNRPRGWLCENVVDVRLQYEGGFFIERTLTKYKYQSFISVSEDDVCLKYEEGFVLKGHLWNIDISHLMLAANVWRARKTWILAGWLNMYINVIFFISSSFLSYHLVFSSSFPLHPIVVSSSLPTQPIVYWQTWCSQGCFTNSVVIDQFNDGLPKIPLKHCHT